MMRTDINLAIVAMVEDPKRTEIENNTDNYCYDRNYDENEPIQMIVRNFP